MTSNAPDKDIATIIPTLRYRDALAAIEWMCNALNFSKRLVVTDENVTVTYAQLNFGKGMIMLDSIRDDAFSRVNGAPADIGGVTRSPYIVVTDIDAQYAREKAAGAEIVIEIRDEDYGGRDYSCCDPEGHLWNFGSYNPWAKPK